MLHYTILYYIILYHTMLCYIILYYTILYYTIPYHTILYYTLAAGFKCSDGGGAPGSQSPRGGSEIL